MFKFVCLFSLLHLSLFAERIYIIKEKPLNNTVEFYNSDWSFMGYQVFPDENGKLPNGTYYFFDNCIVNKTIAAK